MEFRLIQNAVRDTWFIRRRGFLFVIARHCLPTADGELREYMIVGRLGKHPLGFLIEPVDPERHVLVQHGGFEHTPWMKVPVSAEVIHDQPGISLPKFVTPGRAADVVRITCNERAGVNAPINTHIHLQSILRSDRFDPTNFTRNENRERGQPYAWYKQGFLRPKPGACYVERGDNQAIGLPSPEETLM